MRNVKMIVSSGYAKLLYEIKKMYRCETLKVVVLGNYEPAWVTRKSSGLYSVRIGNLPELCDATAEVCARFITAC